MKRIIQKIILSQSEQKKELYQKGNKFEFRSDGSIAIEKGGALTFDTYFNAFSLKKWKKYTNLKNLNFKIQLKGHIRIVITEVYYINIQTYREKEAGIFAFNSSEKKEYEIPIKIGGDADIVFLKLYGQNGECVFYSGEFYTNISDSETNDICIAMGICTYKREEFVVSNIDKLKNSIFSNQSRYNNKFDVYISDNGHTLSTRVKADDNIHIFENRNLGGTGGFCRCMLEALFRKDNYKKYTHILLMDDDILFEEETFLRLFEYLSLLKEAYKNAMVAFSMFPIEQPTLQYTKGKLRERNESKCLKGNLDLKYLKNVLFNETEKVMPNFNGWWCHCIPASYINSTNLPFPFFIRCDDTEYGCRYQNLILTLNGFGIWHPSFEGKHPISISYYDMRNNLIFMTENINSVTKNILLRELFFSYKNALYMDYGKAKIAMQGIEDFLKGPEFLKKADYEELNNSVRQVNYSMIDPPEKYAESLQYVMTEPKKPASVSTLRLYAFLPGLRTKYINCDKKNVSLIGVRKLYCYDIDSKQGYYLKKSRKQAWECRKKYKELYRYIEKNFISIIENWRKNAGDLMTQDFWIEKLGLCPDNYQRINSPVPVEAYPVQPLVDKRDNFLIRMVKHFLPWYTKAGIKARELINAPHFTIRSDFGMYMRFCGRQLLKLIGLSRWNKDMREIRKFKNIHEGERCFITCTGPSLTIEDLEKLKGEYTFGVNSITKAYPYTDWRPTYYALIDAYAYGEILKKEEVYGGKFCERQSFFHYRVKPKTCIGNEIFCLINYSNHWKCRMKKGKIKICDDPAVGLYDCFTVTNMAISLAAYMGFKDIYIIGADATYKLEKTHFIEGEWEKVHKKAQAGLAHSVLLSMVGYMRMRDYYKKKGINIYNATRGGMLEVFPRVDLDKVLEKENIGNV